MRRWRSLNARLHGPAGDELADLAGREKARRVVLVVADARTGRIHLYRAGSLTASVLLLSGDPQLVLDVEEYRLLAVEEARADVRPPAEVGDREEGRRDGAGRNEGVTHQPSC